MNDYGYFKYSDFSVGIKENVTYSTNATLQRGSSLAQLSAGVEPYDYASFEKDKYITIYPKELASQTDNLGFLTANVSNENGEFENDVQIVATFNGYFSMTGITINSINIIKRMWISTYRGNTLIEQKYFTATSKENFYEFNIENVNKIVFGFKKIDKPRKFLGILSINYGKIRIFDESVFSNVEIANKCSIIGDTIEYDTLNLTINKNETINYLFQSKQPIDYIVNGNIVNRFYIESGVESENNTIKITAYDAISNLEGNFLGGIYNSYNFNTLIGDILSGTGVEYECIETSDILLSGYIPICTRRKALQTVLLGSNIRLVKKEKLIFRALQATYEHIYNVSNVGANPNIEKKQTIKSVNLLQHNYSKGSDEEEAYHWYISTTENKIIAFSNPLYNLKAYEVTGVDDNGTDIISETESTSVTFITQSANYCVVSNTSSNKIVIKGKKYVDSTVKFSKLNPIINASEKFDEVNYEDLTILSNPQTVCDYLFNLISRKTKASFLTLEKAKIGDCYNVLESTLNISSIKHNLTGVYETEAV